MVLYGIDIGGTKTAVSIGTPDGRILAHDRFTTPHDQPPERVLDSGLERLEALANAQADLDAPTAVGVACPGPISSAQGRFLDPPNMPRWHGFELIRHLGTRLALPTSMMNDADASVLAESLWGAARGCGCAVYLTMSTGMGAGLLLDGRVYEGACSLAGEIGHVRLRDDGPVGFGKRGSVEGYLSGPGIAQVAEAERLSCTQRGERTRLAPAENPSAALDAEAVCAAALAADPAALRVVDRCATELGRLLAILTDILNPEVFVLGTIGSAHPDLFIPRARAVLEAEAIPHAAEIVRIEPSGLEDRGNQSAIAVACRAAGLI